MRHLLLIIIALTATLSFSTASSVQVATAQDTSIEVTDVFNRFTYVNKEGQAVDTDSKIGAVQSLPSAGYQDAIPSIVTTLLNITGSLALIALTVGGVMMVFGGQNPDTLEKGKKIVTYSVIGLIIIAASYAITLGVANIRIFSTAAPGSTEQSTTAPPSTPAPGPDQSSPTPQPTGGTSTDSSRR